eukprot:Gb_23301 [translate_table: standard]
MVAVVLNSLPPSFEHFVETINMTADEDLTFDQVAIFCCRKRGGELTFKVKVLEVIWLRRVLLQQKQKQRGGKSIHRYNSKVTLEVGNPSGNTSSSDSTSHSSRSRIKCFYCGKIGHVKRVCRKRLFDLENGRG